MNPVSRRRMLLAGAGVTIPVLSGCVDEEAPEEAPDEVPIEDTDEPAPEDPALGLDDLQRTDSHDGIDYSVYYINPLIDAGGDHLLGPETDDYHLFFVEMDAHTGDLRTIDWGEKATLKSNLGVTVDDLEWVWERESDHHPEGYYRTSKTTIDEEVIVEAETETIELVIREVRDGTVSFVWNLTNLEDPDPFPEAGLQSYISNAISGTVSVIDHSVQAVSDTISIANETSHGIAVDPAGEYVYVGGESEDLQIISTGTGEVVDSVDVNVSAHGVDIHPDGQHCYVSWGGFDDEAGVVVVDLDEREVEDTIATDGAAHVNFGPDGDYAYLTNVGQDMVTVIVTDAMEVLTTVDVGETPNEAVGSLDGQYVFTANVADNSVSVIDTDQWEVIEEIPAGEGTHGIDVSRDGNHVWTANRESDDLSVIDIDDMAVTETVDIDVSANHVAITPGGSAAYVTAGRADEVVVVDARRKEILSRMDVGEEPHEIAFTTPSRG